MKTISILGSTGSIGTQALEVAAHLGYRVKYLAAGGSNVRLLAEQAERFKPDYCAVADEKAAPELALRISHTKTKAGSDMAIAAAGEGCGIVLNAIGGTAGVRHTLSAVLNGKDVALANKESLTVAGELVMESARQKNARIIPVDSEHSAIYQCLAGATTPPERITLTASGGPFFGKKRNELGKITPEAALAHPTWRMGAKVSVDSATLMNKGLELLEACMLFDLSEDRIDVVIHRESIVHSLVEFADLSVLAQLGYPDMRMCIQYALTGRERTPSLCRPLRLADVGTLSFYPPDNETFTLLPLARAAAKVGGSMPALYSIAGEMAVNAFLHKRLSFLGISYAVSEIMSRYRPLKKIERYEDITHAKEFAEEEMKKIVRKYG